MPLTEASKSKVSLASISATTAAAAENLWSKSKKSSKRRQKSISEISSLKTAEVPSSSIPSTTTSIINQPELLPLQQQPQPDDRAEFRRKFLEGLQFYCENSSLILNSDLPADLIEFVTSHGFSVESLGIILELKKSSSAFSAYVDKKPVGRTGESTVLGVKPTGDKQAREQNFSEISRRLVQHWMSADSCAEAFVSLSLGEEIPGLIAECASFQRILFAIPDNFHLNGENFLSFLLSQLLIAIRTLAYGISTTSRPQTTAGFKGDDGEPTTVRTHVLAQFLDRIFMRYFSDVEHFHNSTIDGESKNSFRDFFSDLTTLCNEDVIARRLTSKIFLHLGSHSAAKVAKVVFSLNAINEKSAGSVLLWPAFEFLENNSQWKFILQTLPVKTVTKSKQFWLNYAIYVEKESKQIPVFWSKLVEHWIILNKSSLVDAHALYSTSLAITAFAKMLKIRASADDSSNGFHFISHLELGKVLQNIVHSLESINEDKRACGMALGQIVADLQFSMLINKSDSETAGDPKKLKFECLSEMFIDIINFYENESLNSIMEPLQKTRASNSQKIVILDSDDDDEDLAESRPEQQNDLFPTIGEDTKNKTMEIGIDPRILTLRARKRKIPMYFSEIVETLLEKSKNEDEAEILQYIVVLKIPVLLFVGAKLDSKMVTTIARCLADFEEGTSLEIPVQLALHELFVQHPFEVVDVLSEVSFSRDHYALGQRLTNLGRLVKIVELASKQTCYNCFVNPMKKHYKELVGIYPEFVLKYLHSRMKLRFCSQCQSSGLVNTEDPTELTNNISQTIDKNQPLTWREIVDKRVAAKTKYFVTPRSKTVVSVPDDYSSKLLPILWASIANRLTSKTVFYMDMLERQKSGNMHDLFLVKIFQYLARCVLGTSGPGCPHIRNISSHAGELVTSFSHHADPVVRRAAFSLLGVILSVGEGKTYVVEALSSQGNILATVDQLADLEKDPENQRFLNQIQQCLATYTTVGLLKDLGLE